MKYIVIQQPLEKYRHTMFSVVAVVDAKSKAAAIRAANFGVDCACKATKALPLVESETYRI